MLPTIALVGRPNVGKSTLFNRLTRTRNALVANFSGLTRDRQYGEANHEGKRFMVVDTGGITGDDEGIDGFMAGQSLLAIEEADIVLFLVDARDGLTSTDIQIGQYLRESGKSVFVVANKVDGIHEEVVCAPFFELGLGDVLPIAAVQGRGIGNLLEDVLGTLTLPVEEDVAPPKGIKLAIVGRPNVGKSTLVNRLLGEDRVVVYDMPGTTRDSIYIEYERNGEPYTIIDTAGIRKRKNVKLSVEKFSIVKTLQAIDDANVVILVMDAQEGIVDQDLHLMGHVLDSGRALVVALNKWDNLDEEHKAHIKSELDRRLRFIDFADTHFISALHGTGVGTLYKSVHKAYQSATGKLTTNYLTQILEFAVSQHQPPLINGRRIKLRYAHAGGHNPPIIVIHGNQTSAIPKHYEKYLEKVFRKELDLHGTPIRVEFKGGENPFAARKKVITKTPGKPNGAKLISRRSKLNKRMKKK